MADQIPISRLPTSLVRPRNMLDLESDDLRSQPNDRFESTPPVDPPLSHVSPLAHAALSDDDLQTVERVLPPTSNFALPPLQAGVLATPHYIQAIRGKAGAFLKTNLPCTELSSTTDTGIAWLIGRSRNCAIVFPDPAVSRCHAVVGYDRQQGFYVMDVGSSNGTRLNQQRLVAMQRQSLQNGDIVTISHIHIEIFLLEQ
jgi:hypothetical protein